MTVVSPLRECVLWESPPQNGLAQLWRVQEWEGSPLQEAGAGVGWEDWRTLEVQSNEDSRQVWPFDGAPPAVGEAGAARSVMAGEAVGARPSHHLPELLQPSDGSARFTALPSPGCPAHSCQIYRPKY